MDKMIKRRSTSTLDVGRMRTTKAYEKAILVLKEQTTLESWLENLAVVLVTPEREVTVATKFSSKTGKPVEVEWEIENDSTKKSIDIVFNSESEYANETIRKLLKKKVGNDTPLLYNAEESWLVIKRGSIVTYDDHFGTNYSEGISIQLAQLYPGK